MRKILLWLGLGVVVVAGLAFAGWYFFLKTDPKPPAAIEQTPLQTQVPSTGSDASGQDASGTSGVLDGTYTVSPGDTQSFVGYRVTEKLVANISESTATGRTDNVTGTFTVDGTTISDVSVSADLRDLQSDNSFRDGRIRSEGLESDRFPTATFVLTEPLTLSAAPQPGETVTVDATGTFTLHGVTKQVTVPIQARWDGKDIQIVGNLPIAFSDYHISAPTAPAVASVDDHGSMEFQLFFKKTEA
ncbi:MAG TPA: YceI family protein [Acidimicrobiia bacterium]|jgi:polyisoprenoid-binding protein YceI